MTCSPEYKPHVWRGLTKNLKYICLHRGSLLMSALLSSYFLFYLLHFAACSHNVPHIFDCRLQQHTSERDEPTIYQTDALPFRGCHSSIFVSFSYRQHGDVRVHQIVCLHHMLGLWGRWLGGNHDHRADVLRQSWRTQEVRRVLQEARNLEKEHNASRSVPKCLHPLKIWPLCWAYKVTWTVTFIP